MSISNTFYYDNCEQLLERKCSFTLQIKVTSVLYNCWCYKTEFGLHSKAACKDLAHA